MSKQTTGLSIDLRIGREPFFVLQPPIRFERLKKYETWLAEWRVSLAANPNEELLKDVRDLEEWCNILRGPVDNPLPPRTKLKTS